MKAARQPCGFTIFETMIFLAISGIMLGVALNLISGKQSQTEFNQGIRQIQSELQTDISYVSDGYYTSATNFHCSSLNGEGYGAISFSPGTSEQGTNFGCQFIGEAIQFAPDGINTEIKTYPVAGAQYADDNQAPVTSFTEAYPQAVTATSADAVEQLPDGITVGSVTDATRNDWVLFKLTR
jgi:type II secretory pathway pseudopilin PulG